MSIGAGPIEDVEFMGIREDLVTSHVLSQQSSTMLG